MTREEGPQMLKKLERLLPHGAILICNMYIVFYLIDRVNTAMNFIDNGLTKSLLLVLCAVTPFNAWALLKGPRRRRGSVCVETPLSRATRLMIRL